MSPAFSFWSCRLSQNGEKFEIKIYLQYLCELPGLRHGRQFHSDDVGSHPGYFLGILIDFNRVLRVLGKMTEKVIYEAK